MSEEVDYKINAISGQIKTNAADPRLYLERANLLAKTGREKEAVRDFRRAIKMEPNKAEFYMEFGKFSKKNWRIEGVTGAFHALYRTGPERPAGFSDEGCQRL